MLKATRRLSNRAIALAISGVLTGGLIAGSDAAEPRSAAPASSHSIEALRREVGPDLLLVGPVGSIDPSGRILEVLGQSVITSDPSIAGPSPPRVGEMVAIAGRLTAAGRVIARRVVSIPDAFVDGATEVLVTGVVTSSQPSLAKASIGNLSTDYSASLHAGSLSLPVGSAVQITGIRVAESRTVLAFSTRVVGTVSPEEESAASHAAPQGSMGSGPAGGISPQGSKIGRAHV